MGYTFTGFKERGEINDLTRFSNGIETRLPFNKYQFVRVSFTSADQDTDIPHTLNPDNPEDVRYVVVGLSVASVVYQDISSTRKPWQSTHIFLRANVITEAILLLFIGATDVSFFE